MCPREGCEGHPPRERRGGRFRTAIDATPLARTAGAGFNATGGVGVLLHGLCDLFVAFVSARSAANEVDKRVLRKAVFKAASAPAAHPDIVDEMELAPPTRCIPG